MKLYYSKGACSLAVRIVINELGLACQYETVDLASKKTETGEDFLKINPKGSVPALLLDNKQLLTENMVIQQYLADTHPAAGLLPTVGDFARYRVLEWLTYIGTELHKGFSPLFNPSIDAKIKSEIFIPILQKRFAYLNQQIGDKKFLMGDRFTLPDAYLFVMMSWAERFSLDCSNCPNLLRYHSDLKSYPAVKKSLQEEKLPVT